MKFSTALPGLHRYPPSSFPPDGSNWQERLSCADFQAIARAADDAGFDSITVSEHIALPVSLVHNMGPYWPHAFTAMAFIAGATQRIKVSASVIVLPYHHPVNLAKAITTLDVLSSGRVMLCFGVGMAHDEFTALGVPFEKRGRLTDEYVTVMKRLWAEPAPDIDGEFVQVHNVVCEPKPVQQPHPPIWFGGRSFAAMRRSAREGQGWAPSGGSIGTGPFLEEPEQVPEFRELLSRQPGFAGKEDSFDIMLPVVQPRIGPGHTVLPATVELDSTQAVIDEVGRLRDLGVTWTTFPRPGDPPASVADHIESLLWAGEEVFPRFR